MIAIPKRRWFRFSLASVFLFLAIGALCTYWSLCARRANAATARAAEMIAKYQASAATTTDAILASQEALQADLAVPLRSPRAAYETHMRRLGVLRLLSEREYPATAMTRPIVEFTSHYELARRELANVAGEKYARDVDAEFDFPYRDQLTGHPAAERGL